MKVAGWSGDFDTLVDIQEGSVIAEDISTLIMPILWIRQALRGHLKIFSTSFMRHRAQPLPNARGSFYSPYFLVTEFSSVLWFYLFMYGAQVDYLTISVVTASDTTLLQMFNGLIQTSVCALNF